MMESQAPAMRPQPPMTPENKPSAPAPTARGPADAEVAGVIAWPPALFLGSIAIGVLAHLAMPVRAFPPVPARISGGILCGLAIVVALWAERAMHRAGTCVHPWKPTKALVLSGPFQFSRNPMYVSLCVMHLGVGLLVNGWWPIAMTPVLFAVLWWGVVAREERYLERRFGEPYRHYRRSVRRWV